MANVLDPDNLSPRANADDNRGSPGLTLCVLQSWVQKRRDTQCLMESESGVLLGEDLGKKKMLSQIMDSYFLENLRQPLWSKSKSWTFGTFSLETMKSAYSSGSAGIVAGRCLVSQALLVLTRYVVEGSVEAEYILVTSPSAVSRVSVSRDAFLEKAPSAELGTGPILPAKEFLEQNSICLGTW